MFHILTMARALSDDNRARIVMALRLRPLCACEITALLGLAPSTTSKHLFLLKQAKLIDSRKKGKWIYYSLPQKPEASVARTLDWIINELAATPQIEQDAARIPEIIHGERGAHFHDQDIHELCGDAS